MTTRDRLRSHVHALEGERHPTRSPGALEAALRYCEDAFERSGLSPQRRPFTFGGGRHENLVATLPGDAPDLPGILVGAHVDTVAGTPGADDNASGVAGVLEVARALTGGPEWRPRARVELAVFTLEERQGLTYRVGSRRFVEDARGRGMRYGGALIFEMIGYRTDEPRSQRVPVPIRWMDIPRTGDFLACVGDRRSKDLVRTFVEAAAEASPDLGVVTLAVPFRGWIVPATRRSDNASFWSAGHPAVMLTDTADLRNPHYHRRTDRSDTLDYDFMADVVGAAAATVRRLAG
jgi:Zn-dependent M28 family amino/carboxypeptidase